MSNKNKIGSRNMRRKEYEAVKRMDRQQFERFCRELYEDGQQSILKGRKAIDLQEIRTAILEVKGIGEKRADQIIKRREEMTDE